MPTDSGTPTTTTSSDYNINAATSNNSSTINERLTNAPPTTGPSTHGSGPNGVTTRHSMVDQHPAINKTTNKTRQDINNDKIAEKVYNETTDR
jgi:hypothetical protein